MKIGTRLTAVYVLRENPRPRGTACYSCCIPHDSEIGSTSGCPKDSNGKNICEVVKTGKHALGDDVNFGVHLEEIPE